MILRREILINGINIKELDLDDYYKMVGILSIFNRLSITASDNIYVGDIKNENKEDIFCCKEGYTYIYLQLPYKYETFISREIKDGMQLSVVSGKVGQCVSIL